MRETTNFNFKIPEGTDIVNPIIDPYRNWDSIDPILKAVKDNTITNASHVKSGDTHVIIRENPESNNIKFVATGDWRLGDTLTVDGVTVQCRLTDGESLHSNAFVTNQEVFCILHGQVLTLYVTESMQDIKDNITQLQAGEIAINNDLDRLTPLDTTSQTVHGAINENYSSIGAINSALSNSLKSEGMGNMHLTHIEIPNVNLGVGNITLDVSSAVPSNAISFFVLNAIAGEFLIPYIVQGTSGTDYISFDAHSATNRTVRLNSRGFTGYTRNIHMLIVYYT